MRLIFTLLATALLYTPSAFAIKDLLTLCERNLTVGKTHELTLAPNQIALNGKLAHYWESGMESNVGWIMTEEFIRRKISPAGTDFAFWLQPGDRVFIYGENGELVANGYFYENQEQKTMDFGGGMLIPVFTNVPYLYADPDFTQVAVSGDELRPHFQRNARVTVIQTLNEQGIKSLKDRLVPAFHRYEFNNTRDDRFVRVGRRGAYELSHFQTAVTGKAALKSQTKQSQILDMGMGDFMAGPPYWTFEYALQDGPKTIELKHGDHIMLLDENGLVTSEGMIGGPDFPWAAYKEAETKALTAKFAAAHFAFVAKILPRKLD